MFVVMAGGTYCTLRYAYKYKMWVESYESMVIELV